MKKLYKGSKRNYIPFPEELKGKYQYYTEIDLTKLRKAGYTKKFTPLEDGIKRYIKKLKNEI